ncbi:MAG TPA: hypothetical protein DDW76_09435 [Cyanobacteria bacterium UBA11369]|nr:hypothetical protein [Cyanobacteria bacterium UBA11371]HBE17653.1 hypothetical protein [Cyanobacteria bacterium UBA11367]HBE35612.1 hypothetical protein [Cyanobacteria bacterium UBA11368]HBE49002.1 hypothetical protein [Cyanobacteria bacterium UBA11369]
MSTPPPDKTLLALFLALKNLKEPLNQSERAKLYEVGEQLDLDPDDWEFISEGLISIITANRRLDELFQAAKTQLDVVNISQLLPTEKEIAVALDTRGVLERRGEDKREQENRERIIKVAVKFLMDKNLSAIMKQSSWLERVVKDMSTLSN